MDPFYILAFFLFLFVLACGIIKALIFNISRKNRHKTPKAYEHSFPAEPAEVVRTVEETIDQLSKLWRPAAHGNFLYSPALRPEQSHIGGPVYLPEGFPYPCHASGEQMMFIIQINFAESPKLPGYPESGVLQLFGQNETSLGFYGTADGNETKPTLLYWQNPKDLTEKHEAIEVDLKAFQNSTIYARKYYDKDNPIQFALDMHRRGRAIAFQPEIHKTIPDLHDFPADIIIKHDYENENRFGWSPIMNDISVAVMSLNTEAPVKIGGFPSFVQGDNRPYTKDSHGRYVTPYTHVLLTLTSMEVLDIGATGTLNLVITPQDLANADFSKVEFDISWT